jgi:hypothetical protein
MALRPRTYKCAFPGVPEHTFEATERNDSEFCPEHRQAGERRRRALALAARGVKAKVKTAAPLPPPPNTGLLCRKCGRRPSGPLCYACLQLRLDDDHDFARYPQPSPNAPKCGQCDRPRNPFCDRCLAVEELDP